MESEFAVESCIRGTMSTKNLWDASVGEEMPCEWYAVAVISHRRPCTQEDIGCLLAISGRPAACSLFLADQRQRYYSIMSACARASESFATRPRPYHVMTKYWRNLIWRCVHNPPNRQIKFPAKFSGHTVRTVDLSSFPGLLTSTFVTCSILARVSTASDKCWGEKAWKQGYSRPK